MDKNLIYIGFPRIIELKPFNRYIIEYIGEEWGNIEITDTINTLEEAEQLLSRYLELSECRFGHIQREAECKEVLVNKK